MNIKAWLVTGSRVWRDNVWLTEAGADASISARKSDDDRKVPLVDADELSRAYALIEEMREALEEAAGWNWLDEDTPPPMVVAELEAAVEKADTFLAERVK